MRVSADAPKVPHHASTYRHFQYYFQCYCGKTFNDYSELMKHFLKEHKTNEK